VVGTLVDHKGARTVAAVAEAADPRTTEIHLIGHTDGPFPPAALKRMKCTGRYDDTDLAGLIDTVAPHVIWFPVAWPETFSYTLSAAIEAGAAIAATRIGAFPERLSGRPFTWLADIATSPFAWLRLFEDIRKTLLAEAPADAAPPRAAVADFYAAHYLPPLEAPASTRRVPTRPTPERPRVAVVPERFDLGYPTPCAYIRQLQPLHHPAIAGDHAANIIVTQRYAIPDIEAADALAAHARRTGATLLFDLDDDLLNIPRSHPDAAALRPRAKVVRRMLDHADVVWVSTLGLARRLASIRPDATVIENRLDERIWTHSVAPRPFQDGPVRILCMGTGTHDRDFAMIQPALVRLKQEYGARVVVDVLGMTSQNGLPAELNRIGPSTHASQSYPGFVQWINGLRPTWDIGLAPLLDTPFNQCKSPIKAMDYAAMGMLVLASDTPVYRGSLADGPAGQLVPNNAAAWYAALDWQMSNENLRRGLAAGARQAFLANGTLASHAEARRGAWMQVLRGRQQKTAA